MLSRGNNKEGKTEKFSIYNIFYIATSLMHAVRAHRILMTIPFCQFWCYTITNSRARGYELHSAHLVKVLTKYSLTLLINQLDLIEV